MYDSSSRPTPNEKHNLCRALTCDVVVRMQHRAWVQLAQLNKTWRQMMAFYFLFSHFLRNGVYCKKMAGPRSDNFCRHLQVDKLRSLDNFFQNPRRLRPSISRSNIRREYIGKFIRDKSRKRRLMGQTLPVPTNRVSYGLSIAIGLPTFDLGSI